MLVLTFLVSDYPYVLRFIAFITRCDVELDLLTYLKSLISRANDVGVVYKDIGLTVSADETVSLVGVEELNCSLCHFLYLFSFNS